MRRDEIQVRSGIAVTAGCLAATFAYAALRVIQRLGGPEPDPALVFYSEHAGYVWRSWTAGYLGGAIALVAWVFASRSPGRTVRGLGVGLTIATIALVAQAILLP